MCDSARYTPPSNNADNAISTAEYVSVRRNRIVWVHGGRLSFMSHL